MHEAEGLNVVSPVGYFVSEPRDLGLFDAVPVGEYFTAFPVASTDVLRVPFDSGALESFDCTLIGSLYIYLARKEVYQNPNTAYQKRFYLNPCLSASIQELKQTRSGSEYLAVPSESFAAEEMTEVNVYRLVYNLDRVHAALESFPSELSLTRNRLRREALLADFDSLLENVRREVPAFMPNY